MYENKGVAVGHVYSASGDPVDGALVSITGGGNLSVWGATGKGKDPRYPSTTTEDDGSFLIEFVWNAADIAVGEGAPFTLRLWAHTETDPSNWGVGTTTSMGHAWVQGFMFRNFDTLNVFPDITKVGGVLSTLKSMVFKYNKIKFPKFLWLPRKGRMSTESWLVIAPGDVYLNS